MVYRCIERLIKEKEFIQDVRRGNQFARFWIGMTMLINIIAIFTLMLLIVALAAGLLNTEHPGRYTAVVVVAIIAALFIRGIGRWK